MFLFSAPFYLLVLFSLLVPLAIHLLSRKPGPRVKVGSIRLLQNMESTRIKSLKLEEAGLLLLRCLLLALIVLALARPIWQSSRQAAVPRGWVLIHPALLPAESSDFPAWRGLDGESLQSLTEQEHEIRLLAPGFPLIGASIAETRAPGNAWSLLREADHLLPAGTPVRVYSPTRLQDFEGRRPSLDLELQWVAPPSEESRVWIERARQGGADNLLITLGSGNAEAIRFQQFDVPRYRETLAREHEYPFHYDSESASLAIPNEDQGSVWPLVPVDRIAVALVHDPVSRSEDANYLQTAFQLAADYLDLPVEVRLVEDKSPAPTEAALIFWLSPNPQPDWLAEWVAAGGRLWTDAGAAAYDRVHTRFQFTDGAYHPLPGLWRRSQPLGRGRVLWRDAWGAPLLEREAIGAGHHSRFHSRFHPLWSEWVLHPEFPHWAADQLRELAIVRPAGTSQPDTRALDEAQIQPSSVANRQDQPRRGEQTPLHQAFWGLAALCFCLERWLSERRPA